MVLKALAACIALACVWSAAAQGVDDATAAPPTIRFEYAFYAVPADFPYLWVSAYRVGNLKGRATAAWTTADSSASNGVDYRQSTGELSWADGVGGAQQLYVPLIPRRTGPYDRTFTVLLHDQTGAALSFPSAAVVTITQPSVWQLWADASTAGAGADPFGVPTGSTGSAVTNTPSPSDGAGAVTPTSATNPTAPTGGTAPTTPSAGANPNGATPTTPASGGGGTTPTTGSISGGGGSGSSGTGTDPSNTGAGSGSGIDTTQSGGAGAGAGSAIGGGSQPGSGTDPGTGSGTPTAGSGSGSGGSANPQTGGSGTGSSAQPSGSQQSPGGSGQQTGTPPSSGGGTVQPAGGSGSPLSTTTGGSQQQSGGSGGGNAGSASTGILTQFASAFTWDSAAYQTDNSNNFVVVGVSRLQVLPLGLQPCSVRYSTVDGTGRAGVDYTATSGVLEYGANDFAPRAIFVPIRQGDANSAPSGVKVFAIRLSDPVNSFLGVPSSAPISVSAVPFSEGKVVLTSDAYATPVQAGRAVATVQRLIGSAGAVNVTYGTTDGTAKAGTDYTATAGTLSWADGDTAPRNISIPLLASAAAAALPGDGTVAGAPNFFLSLALAADSKGFLGGPRTAAMFITNLAPRSGTGTGSGTNPGNGSGTGTGTTQTNVSGGSSTGGIGTGTGSDTGVKPVGSSTGTNKPPNASSTGTRAPPVVVPPPTTTGTVSTSTGTATNTTTERSGAATVRGLAPAALLTVLLSALWLSA